MLMQSYFFRAKSLNGNHWVRLILFLVLILATTIKEAPAQPLISGGQTQVHRLILAEDWQSVLKALGKTDAVSPVSRMLKGHACLALNRNNESLCLFLQTSQYDDLQKWLDWTQKFSLKHPQEAVAQYLHGDALARMKKGSLAIATFDKALAINPRHVLSLNARGSLYSCQAQWVRAINDLENAINANKTFADAYVSRGTLNIQKKAGAEGAIKWFNQALSHSPDYVLALTGRGCAQVALGHFEEAKQDLKLARNKSRCLQELADENTLRILAYLNRVEEMKLASLSKETMGTELTKRMTDFLNNPNQKTANNYVHALNLTANVDRTLYQKSINEFKTAVATKHMESQVSPYLNNGLKTNDPNGWGHFAVSSIPKDVQVNLSQKLGITILGVGAEAGKGIGLEVGGMKTQEHQLHVTERNFAIFRDLSRAASPKDSVVGGVKTDLSAAHLDEGDWPFSARYGLLYQMQPN